MNLKRLIVAIILGIGLSTLVFTILITVNLSSIDYANFTTEKVFKVLGQTYLRAEMSQGELVKTVVSGPIAVTGIVSSMLFYGGISFLAKNKKKER